MKTRKKTVEPVARDNQAWEILEALIREHHIELDEARIELVWIATERKRSGKIVLGECKVVPELYNRLTGEDGDEGVDIVILLYRLWWEFEPSGVEADEIYRRRAYLLDHELCHVAPKLDEDGGNVRDEMTGRTVYRSIPHDIADFAAPIARWGVQTSDMAFFVNATWKPLKEARQRQLSIEMKAPKTSDSQGAAVN